MTKRFCVIIIFILNFVLSGCNGNTDIQTPSQSSSVTESTSQITIKTLDEAMAFYLQEIEPDGWGQGDYYAGSYRVIDTEEATDKIIIYAYVLSKWVDKNGDMVSGGAGFKVITFLNENSGYKYEKSVYYLEKIIPDSAEIPQAVKDTFFKNADSLHSEMRVEVDQQIENHLK